MAAGVSRASVSRASVSRASIEVGQARAGGRHNDPVERTLAQLERSNAGCITGRLHMPARAAQLAPMPAHVSPELGSALRSRGVTRLYTHQAEAIEAIAGGQDVVVVTPTASGKTICYNVPVIEAVRAQGARALYLFPTKALSQDQVAELMELNKAAELGVRVFTFDGDTPGDARKAVRKHGDIVVTNPDMLHQGILPHHTRWARFFEALKYVVIDEAHIYRGVFGAHVANVIRRLLRIAAFYGARPQFILCSATIGNPGELSEQLIGRPVKAITRSGAPQGPRTLLLWNPPVVNPDLGIRASARSQSSRIARTAVSSGARSIVFAKTRTMVEVLTRYLKDAFDKDTRKPARVRAYRGGYLPNERRDAERALRDGKVDCVVSTSALELGVDIGSLDVCVLNGYPGSIAGTWQRLGRAGRRQRHALGVLVASSDPLDQYVVRHPEFFMDASPENARIAPDQPLIFLDHVRCAAFELPFSDGERLGNVDPVEFLEYLQQEQLLHHESGRWHWMTDSYPANAVSLRRVADGNFVVIDITGGKKTIIAEVDYAGAAMTLYEGAIYQIQAKPWQVEKLDWEGRKAFVRETRADYYTEAIDYTRLKVLETFDAQAAEHALCGHGEVHVVRRVSGYKKIRFYSHENIGYGDVDLPDHEMHTMALWWRLAPEALRECFASMSDALDGFNGAAYALHHAAALASMTETADIGRAVGSGDGSWVGPQHRRDTMSGSLDADGGLAEHGSPGHESPDRESPDHGSPDHGSPDRGSPDHGSNEQFEPVIFLYDNFPGGMGLAEPLFRQRGRLLADALELIDRCDCPAGCPACVGPQLSADEASERTPKQHAMTVLERLSTELRESGDVCEAAHAVH